MNLPMGCRVDPYGGYSLKVNQCWWGHPAEKDTLLYVVGVPRELIPPVVIDITAPGHIVGSSGRSGNGGRLKVDGSPWRSDLSKRLREATPEAFARWLVAIARRVRTVPSRARHGAQYVAERDAAAVFALAQHGGRAARVRFEA